MNALESRLASALKAETDRTTLDLDTVEAARELEARLDQVDRDRRHRAWRTVLAAAAAVLVAGGVYGVIKLQASTSDEPIKKPYQTSVEPYYRFTQIAAPGTYQLYVGHDATGAAVNADLSFHGRWQGGNFPVVFQDRGYGGVAVYHPKSLAAGTGCLGGRKNTGLGQTPTQLAQQLARLPRSTVLQAPTPVEAFGRRAVHLRLLIDQHCGTGVYRVAWTARGGHGISYGNTSKDVTIDFWVSNVDGIPVVVETWHQAGASSALLGRIAQTKASIKILTGD